MVSQLRVRTAASLQPGDFGEQEAQAGGLDGRSKVAGGRGQRVVGGAVQFLAGRAEARGGTERFGLALAAAGRHAGRRSKRAAVEHGARVPGPSAHDEGGFGQGWGVLSLYLHRQARGQETGDTARRLSLRASTGVPGAMRECSTIQTGAQTDAFQSWLCYYQNIV